MNSHLKVAIVPLNITWNDRDENLYNTGRVISKIDRDTDIVILPEMFSTGFVDDEHLLRTVSETNDGPTMTHVRRWAREANMAICGSFIACDGDVLSSGEPAYYNRAFFVEPSGETVFYDKRHLLSISPEARVLSRGDMPIPVVRYRGWNVAMCVCYDIRFPVWCRRTEERPYDILLVPANWPDARGYAWEHLLIARAIENQAVMVGANRSGADDYGTYDRLSFIFDCKGAPAWDNLEDSSPRDVIYAHLDKAFQDLYRTKFPVQRDADTFTISI